MIVESVFAWALIIASPDRASVTYFYDQPACEAARKAINQVVNLTSTVCVPTKTEKK